MARTVKYSVIPRINPRDRETEPKFYAQVKLSGDVSLREMCERIQQSCSVTKADVHAVLVAMEDVIVDALKGGEIIRLGDLGTLRVSLSSKGALTEKEYTSSLITKSRIIFRPGSILSEALANLSYTKLTVETESDEDEGEVTTGGEGA
ncbi:MAG: HU family DNA-binding protein [Bacteroidaceae bacterium]|nr:HU family DNA-binding protein [Bacteroidaceae bacterium]